MSNQSTQFNIVTDQLIKMQHNLLNEKFVLHVQLIDGVQMTLKVSQSVKLSLFQVSTIEPRWMLGRSRFALDSRSSIYKNGKRKNHSISKIGSFHKRSIHFSWEMLWFVQTIPVSLLIVLFLSIICHMLKQQHHAKIIRSEKAIVIHRNVLRRNRYTLGSMRWYCDKKPLYAIKSSFPFRWMKGRICKQKNWFVCKLVSIPAARNGKSVVIFGHYSYVECNLCIELCSKRTCCLRASHSAPFSGFSLGL